MERPEGTIKALFRYPKKGAAPVAEQELTLEEGRGILGDCHGDGGQRQISLLTVTEKNWMECRTEKGFCFHKYKENLLLDGVCLKNFHAGDRLCIGTAVLEITDDAKSCHRELCELVKTQENCILAGSRSFAAVKKGGRIRTEMKAEHHCAVHDDKIIKSAHNY